MLPCLSVNFAMLCGKAQIRRQECTSLQVLREPYETIQEIFHSFTRPQEQPKKLSITIKFMSESYQREGIDMLLAARLETMVDNAVC